jgi:phosphoribosylformylglycinamidine synthase
MFFFASAFFSGFGADSSASGEVGMRDGTDGLGLFVSALKALVK